jgi:Sulfotransferase domain
MIGSRAAEALRRWNFRRTVDVAFVGYPKTGNTWLRFLVGNYLRSLCGATEMPLFDGHDRWGRCQRACAGPAIHFTHEPLEPDGQPAVALDRRSVVEPFRRKKVVVIARYPLDALVSDWLQRRKRGAADYEAGLPEFLADAPTGLEKYMRFYSLWDAAFVDVDARLVRYEDLKADAAAELRALLEFLDIEPDDGLVGDAVERSSFASMRQLEESGATPRYGSGLEVFATGDRSDPEAYHVRRGVVGGYRDYLAPDEALVYERHISEEMPPRYGYAQAPLESSAIRR